MFYDVIGESAATAAANAILFSFPMTSEQIPQTMSGWVLAQHLAPWMFLLIINLTLLAAGQVMEPTSIILILAPLFLPIAKTLGYLLVVTYIPAISPWLPHLLYNSH